MDFFDLLKMIGGLCLFLFGMNLMGQGLERRELRGDLTANEIINDCAMFEHGLMYDWCLCGGEYSLRKYSADIMPGFLSSFLPK